jgi:hypothetical protein
MLKTLYFSTVWHSWHPRGGQISQEKKELLVRLRRLKEEIENKEEKKVNSLGVPGKKVKQDTEVQISIQFDLPFDDEEGEK